MNFLHTLIERIDRVERGLMVTTLVTMTLALLIQIAMREAGGDGLLGINRFATYLMIWSAYFGLEVATAQGAHLRPRFADNWFPKRFDGVIRRLGSLLSAAIFVVMLIAAISFVHESYQFEERAAVLNWLTWPIQVVLPLVFGLSALRHLAYAACPGLAPSEEEIPE